MIWSVIVCVLVIVWRPFGLWAWRDCLPYVLNTLYAMRCILSSLLFAFICFCLYDLIFGLIMLNHTQTALQIAFLGLALYILCRGFK